MIRCKLGQVVYRSGADGDRNRLSGLQTCLNLLHKLVICVQIRLGKDELVARDSGAGQRIDDAAPGDIKSSCIGDDQR